MITRGNVSIFFFLIITIRTNNKNVLRRKGTPSSLSPSRNVCVCIHKRTPWEPDGGKCVISVWSAFSFFSIVVIFYRRSFTVVVAPASEDTRVSPVHFFFFLASSFFCHSTNLVAACAGARAILSPTVLHDKYVTNVRDNTLTVLSRYLRVQLRLCKRFHRVVFSRRTSVGLARTIFSI